MFDVIIKDAFVVFDEGVSKVNIGINNGIISEVFSNDKEYDAVQTYSYENMYILPGGIDTHSHVTYCGSFKDGSKSAAAGGISTIIEMPISGYLPSACDEKIYLERVKLGEEECVIDFALWAGIQPNAYQNIKILKESGAAAFKVFMSNAGDYKYFDDYSLYTLMLTAKEHNALIGIHAENESLCNGFTSRYKDTNMGYEFFCESRPVIAESEAVLRACFYALNSGCKTHICHVSNPRTAELILEYKKKGANITFETCPHYLSMTREDIGKYGAFAKCSPPLRYHSDVDSLWELVRNNDVDCIGTDHATYSSKDKSDVDFWKAPGGFPGNDLSMPTLLDEGVIKRHIPIETIAKMISNKPAKSFGLDYCKGGIKVGHDADLVVVNLDSPWVYHAEDSLYAIKTDKYATEGKCFTSKVCATFVRGEKVYSDGTIVAQEGTGKYIKSIGGIR